MDKICNACFFSGHRKIKKSLHDNIKALLKQEIKKKYEQGIKTFITGGAVGFDTIAADIVLELQKSDYPDIELHLYLPCYKYEERLSYNECCALHRIKCLSNHFEIIDKENNNNDSIKMRNYAMVDNACCGIVYNNHFRSGTYQTISYAKRNGKEFINISDLIWYCFFNIAI